MCCTRLAENAGSKNVTKNRHLGTIGVWQTSNLRRLRLGEEKKKERRKKDEETTGQKYNGLPYSVGRPLKLFLVSSPLYFTAENSSFGSWTGKRGGEARPNARNPMDPPVLNGTVKLGTHYPCPQAVPTTREHGCRK